MNVTLYPGYAELVDAFASRGVDLDTYQESRPGRPFPNPETCLKIQCGAISQEEAGFELLADCAMGGFAGSMSCAFPECAPYCGNTGSTVGRGSQPLPISERIAMLFIDGPARGCNPVYSGYHFGGPYSEARAQKCGCVPSGFIAEHPFLSLAGVVAAGVAIWRMK